MEYFTDEILTFDPFASKQVQAAQDLKWQNAVQAYRARFRGIEGRLLRGVSKFYSGTNFHDYNVISLQTREPKNKILPLEVILEIRKGTDSFALHYSSVRMLQVHYKNEMEFRGFGSFVYEELLDVDENFLSHEILLTTGSSLKIVFKNKSMKIKKS